MVKRGAGFVLHNQREGPSAPAKQAPIHDQQRQYQNLPQSQQSQSPLLQPQRRHEHTRAGRHLPSSPSSSARLWPLGAVLLVTVGSIVGLIFHVLPSPLHTLPPERMAEALGVHVPPSMASDVLRALDNAARLDAVLDHWAYVPMAGKEAAREYLLTHPHLSKHITAFLQVVERSTSVSCRGCICEPPTAVSVRAGPCVVDCTEHGRVLKCMAWRGVSRRRWSR